MAKYRKIDPRIWNDSKFRSFSDRGKLAFLFILTHPHMTPLGAMRASIPGMAAELGWTEKAFREAFGEAFRKACLRHDESASFVWVPNFLRYNPPESPNVVTSWAKCWDDVPECPLKHELWQHVKDFAEGFPEAFAKAFGKAFAKGMPNQEQEQEQEQEVKKNTKRKPAGKPQRQPPTVEEIAAYCVERSNDIDPEHFHAYYATRGWRTKSGPIKDWRACVVTWEKNRNGFGNEPEPAGNHYPPARSFLDDDE